LTLPLVLREGTTTEEEEENDDMDGRTPSITVTLVCIRRRRSSLNTFLLGPTASIVVACWRG
jgi:hypothetical protein